ncbi:MAG: hypothetical protein ACREEE_07125, partial [Dongiaceae bacterium]
MDVSRGGAKAGKAWVIQDRNQDCGQPIGPRRCPFFRGDQILTNLEQYVGQAPTLGVDRGGVI